MLNYNIDSTLIFMMKDLILINNDLLYFDTYFMPYIKLLN